MSAESSAADLSAPAGALAAPAQHATATVAASGHGHAYGAAAAPKASGETTHAIVFRAAGSLGTHEASLREANADDVVVDTTYSSISAGTERLLFAGRLPGFPMLRFPLVPGYEAVGTVARVGADVAGVAVGDEVFVGGSMCYTDVAGVFGGNAARTIKRGSLVVPLHGIPMAHAPLLALAATSLHGVRRLGDVAGKRVAVLGMGAIGHFAARFLVAGGARVTCCDVSAARLADVPDGCEALDVARTPLDDALRGLDAVVEATGRSEELARCARALRPGGTIVILSYYDDLHAPFVDLFVNEVSLLVAREWAHVDLVAARDAFASGAIGVGRMADHVVPVADYAAAYATAFEDPSVPKVILQWA
ncbi:MAG: zinc-binding dehydrogenase [Vulcanimicrobiaceae bacterium]